MERRSHRGAIRDVAVVSRHICIGEDCPARPTAAIHHVILPNDRSSMSFQAEILAAPPP